LRHEQGGRLVLRRVNGAVRLAVASQKVLQPQHIGTVQVADQYGSAASGVDMGHAAQDQRPDDPLAKLGFGDDQRVKPIGRDEERFDLVIIRFGVDHRDAGGELSDLAGELSRSVADDLRPASQSVTRDHRQCALQHDEHAGRVFSRPKQPLATAVLATLAESLDARDISLAKDRKGLIAAPPDDAIVWVHLDAPRGADARLVPSSRTLRHGGE
jgi:hypothetical protein